MAEELNIKEYVAGLVEKARAAQKIAENFTQEDVDLITAAVTYELTKPESGMKGVTSRTNLCFR